MSLNEFFFFRARFIKCLLYCSVMISCDGTGLMDQLPDGNQLVINGLITNEEGIVQVTIFRTVPFLSRDSLKGVTGANVFVVDNLDDTLKYEEKTAGVYESTDVVFSGNIGSTYRLRIELEDSTTYESPDEFLNDMGVLDEFKCINCSEEDINQQDKRMIGVINASEDASNLYRWKIYKNGNLLSKPEDIMLINPKKPGLSNHAISHRTFNIGDTVWIEQLSLGEENFDFLKLIMEQSSGQSESPVLPASAIGNIRNINNSEEEVLGFFGASAIKKSDEIIISSGAP